MLLYLFLLFNLSSESGGIIPTDNSKETLNNIVGSNSSANEPSDSEISIKEQVLLDSDGIKITAVELIDNAIWGKGIKVLIENNSDKDLGVGCDALIVNNYMISNLFSANIAAGKKSNETIYMSSSELETAGIDNIGQIEIYFNIYDKESYETIFKPDCVTIKTNAFDKMDTVTSTDGDVLVNQDGIKIIGKYVNEGSIWGAAILLYIENKTGKDIGITCDNISINGYMVTSYFSCTVYKEKMALDDITILTSDLEDNKIETINDIELSFNIYCRDTYESIMEVGPTSFKIVK